VFVKVLDIRLNRALSEPLKDLEVRIQRFNYESEIARSCAAERLSRVAHAIADGVLQVGGTLAQFDHPGVPRFTSLPK
jgi:hypothetical protein